MVRDLIALENSSRVWIYQADRDITYDELDEMRPEIFEFLDQWTSHNHELLTYGNVFHRRFIALFVDDTIAGPSGCSIDKSVKFIEYLGSKYKVDLFNRNLFAYMQDDEVKFIEKNSLKLCFDNGDINHETLFFDHLVQTKGDFLKRWITPLKNTWINKFIK
jgi:hypothetical protein